MCGCWKSGHGVVPYCLFILIIILSCPDITHREKSISTSSGMAEGDVFSITLTSDSDTQPLPVMTGEVSGLNSIKHDLHKIQII